MSALWKRLLPQSSTFLSKFFPTFYKYYELSFRNSKNENIALKQMSTFFLFQTTPLFYDILSRYHSFPDPSYDWVYSNMTHVDRDQVLAGTYYIQHKIWENQHPPDCSKARFLFVSVTTWGLGSQLHRLGSFLGAALDHQLVLAYYPVKTQWIDPSFCSIDTYDCYFEPLTHCSFDQTFYTQLDKAHVCVLHDLNDLNHGRPSCQYYVLQDPIKYGHYFHHVPFLVQTLFKGQHYERAQSVLYWRTQALTYLVRYNKRTLEWTEAYYKTNCVHCSSSIYDFAIHIRHGDKGKEMTLLPAEDYDVPLRLIAKMTHMNCTAFSIYLRADDEASLDYFRRLYPSLAFLQQEKSSTDVNAVPHIMLVSLANLRQQIRGLHTIGTFSSNWVRVIYELKSTVGYLNNGYYLEVGDFQCIPYRRCMNSIRIPWRFF